MRLTLRPYQSQGLNDIRSALAGRPSENLILRRGHHGPAQSVLYVLPTGGGKCLAEGTPVLMYDGSVKPVEAVNDNDLLLGPDSNPRRVVSTTRGQEMMYRVTPAKGDPYIVNESHILSLRITGKDRVTAPDGQKYRGGDICNIEVRDYLRGSKTFKHVAKGWRSGAVDFSPSPANDNHPIPPYILGAWLGDGTSRRPEICSVDREVVEEWSRYCDDIDHRLVVLDSDRVPIYRISAPEGSPRGKGVQSNELMRHLRAMDLLCNKHIPGSYKTASRRYRLELLAGIIDTDGYLHHGHWDVVLKQEALARDVAFVARSLGLAAYVKPCRKTCTNTGSTGEYWRITISGRIDQVPCRVPRRQAAPRRQVKDVTNVGINVDPIGVGTYYGFTLEGPDRLFLLGDFTVTHNTVTYAAVAEGAAAKGNRVLILEHRKELIYQASMALARLGVPHRVVAPPDKVAEIRRRHVAELGRPYVNDKANVAVASVQTLARRMTWLAEYHPALVICDEAHHAVAGTWKRIMEATDYARHLGVTATPCRTNGQGMGDVYQTMVLGPSMADLIELGNLCAPRVFAPPLRASLEGVHTKSGDWDAKEMAEILDRPTITGDAVEHYRKMAPGRPAIVFTCNRKHAQHVAAQFQAAGFRFYVVDGTMDDTDRDRIINGLADGSVQGLVSVDIISEGTDIPCAEVAIMLRATQSESLYLQQAGRVLRPAEGKQYGLILDHVGNALRHGLPQTHREWTLEGRRRRKRGPREIIEEERIAQCPKCYQVHEPAPVCPECGYVYEAKASAPKQRDGELAEIQESEEDRQRREARRAQGAARTKEALVRTGKSEAQAEHILKARREKERLQQELRDACRDWLSVAQLPIPEVWGFRNSDIDRMKPKQLRELARDMADQPGLAAELGALLASWEKRTGRHAGDAWGCSVSRAARMLPADLRHMISEVSESLFSVPANDNASNTGDMRKYAQ